MIRPAFAFLLALTAGDVSAQYRSPDFDQFLRLSGHYARDAETLAYVRGAIDVIRLMSYCSALEVRNADEAMRALVRFGATPKGELLAMSNFSGIKESVGSALIVMAREAGCALPSR